LRRNGTRIEGSKIKKIGRQKLQERSRRETIRKLRTAITTKLDGEIIKWNSKKIEGNND
jgi:hypothetical protein